MTLISKVSIQEKEKFLTKLIAENYNLSTHIVDKMYHDCIDEMVLKPERQSQYFMVRLQSYLIAISTVQMALQEVGQYREHQKYCTDILEPDSCQMIENLLAVITGEICGIPTVLLEQKFTQMLPESIVSTDGDRLTFKMEFYINCLERHCELERHADNVLELVAFSQIDQEY